MYLTNEDRIRLGLQEYGCDVPDDLVAAAEAALAGSDGAAEEKPATTRKRARNRGGEFQADDPATAETNEAFVEG